MKETNFTETEKEMVNDAFVELMLFVDDLVENGPYDDEEEYTDYLDENIDMLNEIRNTLFTHMLDSKEEVIKTLQQIITDFQLLLISGKATRFKSKKNYEAYFYCRLMDTKDDAMEENDGYQLIEAELLEFMQVPLKGAGKKIKVEPIEVWGYSMRMYLKEYFEKYFKDICVNA